MAEKKENKKEKKVSNTAKRTAAAKAASKKKTSTKASAKSSATKSPKTTESKKPVEVKKSDNSKNTDKDPKVKDKTSTVNEKKDDKQNVKKAAGEKKADEKTNENVAEDKSVDEKTKPSEIVADEKKTNKNSAEKPAEKNKDAEDKEAAKTNIEPEEKKDKESSSETEKPEKEKPKASSNKPAHAATAAESAIPTQTDKKDEPQKICDATSDAQDSEDAQKEEKKQEIMGKHAARMEQHEKEKAEKARKKHNAKIAGICIGAVAAIYLIGVVLFSNFTYPQTYLGGSNLGFKSLGNLTETLSQVSDDYTLNVEGLGMELEISGQSIDYNFDANDVANKIVKQQNAFLWPFEIAQTHTFEDNYVVNFDEGKLTSLVNPVVEAHNANAVRPVNAGFNIDVAAKTATIKPEVTGNTLDGEKTLAAIKGCVGSSLHELELNEEHQVLPSVLSSDSRMDNALSTANKMLQSVMTFTMGTTPVSTLTANDFGAWIEVGPDYNAIVNQEAAYAWAGVMSDTYNTVGTARTFTTPYGKTLSVTSSMGWEIDEDGLVATLNENVVKGSTVTVAVPCSSSTDTYVGKGARDWGNRYIDVDLSTQTVRMYDDSGAQIFETACVTGKPATPTPSGMFTVYSKASPTVLNADDGSYHTPVQYWMPFSGGCGFHDATWQSSFGGNRWCSGYGSHGCVNLSLAAAGQLYSLCKTGDIVIVHS